jgi:hypothetical protein
MVDDHADKLAGVFLGTTVGDVTDARKHVRNPDRPSRQAKVKVAANRSS